MGDMAVIESALEACESLQVLANDCGHFAHMPAHIYCLTGRWQQVCPRCCRGVVRVWVRVPTDGGRNLTASDVDAGC